MARAAALVLAASAALLSGCGGSGYRYVSNTEDGAFFRVPEDWAVFDEEAILTAGDGITEEQVENLRDRIWLRGFDAADDPSPENVVTRATDAPRGYAEVRRLDEQERSRIDLITLRSLGFPLDPTTGAPTDPIAAFSADPNGAIQVLEYDDDLVVDDGIRGVRITAMIDGDEPSVFEQISLVDPATTRRYVFLIGCHLTCWEENDELISEIVDSWTVREDE